MTWPELIKRHGPLVLEDYTAMSGDWQRLGIECELDAGGCGFSARFYRQRNNYPRARRAFRQHARRCPQVPHTRRRWLAAVGVALILAVLAVAATVAGMASRATPAPTPPIGIVTTTTTTTTAGSASAARGYRATPAGPPVTDHTGQWLPAPDQPSTTEGGGR